MHLIVLAIPVFFVLIAVETSVATWRRLPLYRGVDVTACLALGTLQTLCGVVAAGALSALYQGVYAHRLWTLPGRDPVVLVLAFVAVDFLYYWFHRVGHRVMCVWATHAPHHSSEDYNLAVALRQGPVQPLVSRLFFLPLAWVGLDIESFAILASLNTLGQFWIHTRLIGRLGPLEWVLNTPSHHRVHHGCNGRYLDKNHGGVLIVWDRLFGTFVAEDDRDPPVFGTVKQATTWNPLRLWWLPFGEIVAKVRAARGPGDVVRAFLAPPEWLPAGLAPVPAVDGPRQKYASAAGGLRGAYAGVQFVVVLVASVGFLAQAPKLPWATAAVVVAWLAWSFGSVGAVLDRSRFAVASELVRHVVAVAALLMLVR
jgi:sterol desaturase/sphingolipid hydroxylase (fatty acid hydroxylase superfamily)